MTGRFQLTACSCFGEGCSSKLAYVAEAGQRNDNGLSEAHQSELRGLGVARLGLFGSFVRDEATPESDVDILVEFEAGKKGFAAFMELAFWLEDALQRPVELVTA